MPAAVPAPCAVDFLPLRCPRGGPPAAPAAPAPPPYAAPCAGPLAPGGAAAAVAAALRDFAARAALRPAEAQQRREFVAAVRRGVAELWEEKTPRVVTYGSFALGVSTPASDIDLTVLFDGEDEGSKGKAKGGACEGDADVRQRMEADARNIRRLYQISQKLATMGYGVTVYEFCRVPVANVRDRFSNLTCDINVGLYNVEKALDRQRKWLNQSDEARGLILVTKAVLKQWGLNSLFHGGLSSTALYVLVHRFMEERYCSGYYFSTHAARESSCNRMPLTTSTKTKATTTATPAAVAGERGLNPDLLLEFWNYASTDVFMTGCLFDVFATDTGKPPAGARDLTAGSYRLPEVLGLFHNLAMLLENTMNDDSQKVLRTGGLDAIFADPRQHQEKKELCMLSPDNKNAVGGALKRQCLSQQLNGRKVLH